MQRRTAALGLAATALLVAGCGPGDDTAAGPTSAATTAASKPAKVAYLTYALTDYVQAEQKGLEETLEGAGGSVTVFSANFDPQKQLQQCQDAVTSGRYDAIVLTPVTPPTGVPCVAAAKAAGVPVVSIETPTGTSLDAIRPQLDGVVGSVVIPVSTNAKASAALTADACRGLDPCRIIAEVATPNDVLTNGQVDEIKKTVPNAEVVQTIAGQFDPSVIAKAAPDALAAHPDVQVWVSTADTQALAIVPALKQAGLLGKVKLIGNGGSRLGAEAVADGTLYGTVGGWPEQDGRIAAKMALQAVDGQAVEPAGVDALKVDTPLVVTRRNVAQFTPEWGAQRPAQ